MFVIIFVTVFTLQTGNHFVYFTVFFVLLYVIVIVITAVIVIVVIPLYRKR